jgi:hypothetical protein
MGQVGSSEMKIELKMPDELPHGHGASFKKGIAEAILESSKTELNHTPEGHDDSRKKGFAVGEEIAKFVSSHVKP